MGARATRRSTTAGAVALAACLSTGDARADFDFQAAATVRGGWLRRLPRLRSEAVSTSAREMGESSVETGGGLATLGVGGDIELTIDDRWRVPLLGGYIDWALGSYAAERVSLDGSVARLRPWTAVRGDILLPGVGHRWKHRRMMWGAAVRTGFSSVMMQGSVAAGRETAPLELTASTFLLQVEIEGCRRLDPTTRVCLQVAPRIYEHELANGLIFGLRMEWGR